MVPPLVLQVLGQVPDNPDSLGPFYQALVFNLIAKTNVNFEN